MNRFVKFILYILVYISLFVASFGIISNRLNIQVLSDIKLQLYIGIIALVVTVILLTILIFSKEFKDDDIDNEEDEIFVDEVNEKTTINIEVEEPETVLENNSVSYSVETNEIKAVEQTEEVVEEVVEEVIVKKVEPLKDVNTTTTVSHGLSEEEIHNIINSVERNSKASESLSETQLIYINSSDNSYINTAGLPQLKITQVIDSKEVVSAAQKAQIEEEKLKREALEEQEYRKEEKREAFYSFVGKVSTVLIIVALIFGLYFFFRKFIG